MSDLDVRQLLEEAYKKISEGEKRKTIELPERATAEIADDSDWHRNRTGYMCYETAVLVELGNRWAVALGKKCGDYPGDSYNCDLMAVKVSGKGKELVAEIDRRIGGSSYFRNSLVCGMRDGSLAVMENSRFKEAMLTRLNERIGECIAKEPEYDPSIRYLDLTLAPVCKSTAKYKPGFASYIAESIEDVLREESGKVGGS
jgi:hypothetical protein